MKERNDNFQPGSSIRRESADLWRGLWKMQTSNAIKNFMWRVCKNILPTKDNLMKQRVIEDSLCPICSLEAETSYQILWGRPSVKDVWGASFRIFQKSNLDGTEFDHIAEAFYEKCGGEDFYLFSETARKVWWRRNAWVREGSFLHPDVVVRLAGGALEEF